MSEGARTSIAILLWVIGSILVAISLAQDLTTLWWVPGFVVIMAGWYLWFREDEDPPDDPEERHSEDWDW